MRQVALLGGSFDPVHRAHLALARAALAQLPVDELWWLPAGQPWQKARTLAPAEHRVAMIGQVLQALPPAERARHRIETCEIDRGGPTYTIDTLEQLSAQHPQTRWWLILGQDQLKGLPTWRRWQAVLDHANLAVARRPGSGPNADGPAISVHPLEFEPQAISSTAIRALAAQGLPLDDQVTPEVGRYIAAHGLYRHRA